MSWGGVCQKMQRLLREQGGGGGGGAMGRSIRCVLGSQPSFLPQSGTGQTLCRWPRHEGTLIVLFSDAGRCDLQPEPGPGLGLSERRGAFPSTPARPCGLVLRAGRPSPPPPPRQARDSLPTELRVMPPNSLGLKSRPFPLCKCEKRKFIKLGLCT